MCGDKHSHCFWTDLHSCSYFAFKMWSDVSSEMWLTANQKSTFTFYESGQSDQLQQRTSGFWTVTIRYPRRICLIIKANAKISHQICNDCNEKKSSVDQLMCDNHIHDDKSSQLTRVMEMRRVCQQLFNVRFIVSFRNNCFWLLYTGSYQLIDTGCSIAQWRRAKNREYWILEKRETFCYESHVVLIPTHPSSSHKIRM